MYTFIPAPYGLSSISSQKPHSVTIYILTIEIKMLPQNYFYLEPDSLKCRPGRFIAHQQVCITLSGV
jgi:hypothetical protein